MNLSLHGDNDHPDIAATLFELGSLSQQAGDLRQTKQHFDESLKPDINTFFVSNLFIYVFLYGHKYLYRWSQIVHHRIFVLICIYILFT